MRVDVTSSTCVSCRASTSRGANTTSTPRVVEVVTIVLAESEVGFPNGPIRSASVIRFSTRTSSLRMPAYDSPALPRRSSTSPSILSASYSPYGSWNSSEHQLHTSTMLLMRGSVSPFRTRRSRASDDGRVLVGSSPTRLYIVLTAVTSTGGLVRTAASAAARGALRRGSRSTTVAPSSHSAPARTIVARSGATESFNGAARFAIGRRDVDVGFRVGRDDAADTLGEFPRVGAAERRGVDRLVDDQPDIPGIRCESAFQHHVTAADHGDRNYREARLEREIETAPLEASEPSVAASRALWKHDEAEAVRGQSRRPSKDPRPVRTAAIDQHVPRAPQVPAEKRKVPERLLGDDPELKRQRPEQDRDVVDALVIGDEDVGAIAREPLEAHDLDPDPRRRQNQPRPGPRAPVRKVAGLLEQARCERQRAEDDRVQRDGGDQIEDGPPPVIRRKSVIQNAKCKMQTDSKLRRVCILNFAFCILSRQLFASRRG